VLRDVSDANKVWRTLDEVGCPRTSALHFGAAWRSYSTCHFFINVRSFLSGRPDVERESSVSSERADAALRVPRTSKRRLCILEKASGLTAVTVDSERAPSLAEHTDLLLPRRRVLRVRSGNQPSSASSLSSSAVISAHNASRPECPSRTEHRVQPHESAEEEWGDVNVSPRMEYSEWAGCQHREWNGLAGMSSKKSHVSNAIASNRARFAPEDSRLLLIFLDLRSVRREKSLVRSESWSWPWSKSK
jgi:hypothetical protein